MPPSAGVMRRLAGIVMVFVTYQDRFGKQILNLYGVVEWLPGRRNPSIPSFVSRWFT